MNISPPRPAPGADHFHHQLLADPTALIPLRATLADWLAHLIPPWADIQREDILLATYEALANAAEHAYPDTPDGQINLEATKTGDELTITVRDAGTWKLPTTTTDPYRGRGLYMIRALTERNTIANSAHGTEVTMTWLRTAA